MPADDNNGAPDGTMQAVGRQVAEAREAVATGRYDDAAGLLEEAVLAAGRGVPVLVPDLAAALARLCLTEGRETEAEQWLSRSAHGWRGIRSSVAQVLLALDQATRDGDVTRAEVAWRTLTDAYARADPELCDDSRLAYVLFTAVARAGFELARAKGDLALMRRLHTAHEAAAVALASLADEPWWTVAANGAAQSFELARFDGSTDRLDQAVHRLSRLRDHAIDSLGPTHLVSFTLRSHAVVAEIEYARRIQSAQRLRQHCVELAELTGALARGLGQSHPIALASAENLGSAWLDVACQSELPEDAAEAVQSLDFALAALAGVRGDGHPAVDVVRHQLGLARALQHLARADSSGGSTLTRRRIRGSRWRTEYQAFERAEQEERGVETGQVVVSLEFDSTNLLELRQTVAGQLSLPDAILTNLVLVVNELAVNAIRHGGGRGRLVVTRFSDYVRCEIVDEGGGFDASQTSAGIPPPTIDSRGMWIVRQLADEVQIRSGPDGTAVSVTMRT